MVHRCLQEHVWSYLFNEKMHIDTKDHRVLLTEAPLNPRENRIKMAEVMFEKYGFQAMQVRGGHLVGDEMHPLLLLICWRWTGDRLLSSSSSSLASSLASACLPSCRSASRRR